MTTGLVHLPMLNTWKVSDPAVVLQILRHKAVKPPALSLLIKHAESRHGLSLAALKRVVTILPIFLEDRDHAERRKSTALFIQNGAARAEARVKEFLQSKNTAAMGSKADLVAEWVRPVTGIAVGALTGLEITPFYFGRHLIEIFNCNQNIAGLKRLEEEFAAVLGQVEAGGADDALIKNKLVALVFGFDSMASLLADNLLIGLRRAEAADSQLFLPEDPPGTGVPVTYRIAAEPVRLAGIDFPTGARFMLEFGRFGEAPDAATRQGIFGAGAHVCLGRMVSNAIWRAFRKHVNDVRLKAQLVSCESSSSLFFRYYKSINVEISQ
jgi:cytochrome P450